MMCPSLSTPKVQTNVEMLSATFLLMVSLLWGVWAVLYLPIQVCNLIVGISNLSGLGVWVSISLVKTICANNLLWNEAVNLTCEPHLRRLYWTCYLRRTAAWKRCGSHFNQKSNCPGAIPTFASYLYFKHVVSLISWVRYRTIC